MSGTHNASTTESNAPGNNISLKQKDDEDQRKTDEAEKKYGISMKRNNIKLLF